MKHPWITQYFTVTVKLVILHMYSMYRFLRMLQYPSLFDMPGRHTNAKTGARKVQVRDTKGGKKRAAFVVTCQQDIC